MHGEVIALNAWRELEEEVSLQGELSWRALRWKPLGLLNDDRDEVGRVHLGVVFTMEIPPDHEVIVVHFSTSSFVAASFASVSMYSTMR